MFELTIKGEVHQFNFGMGFLREINKTVCVPVEGAPGLKKNAGLRYKIAGIIDGDVEVLAEVLDIANKNQGPRLTRAAIDAHIDDENTDINQLFEDVLGFLTSANATRKTTEAILKVVEEEKQKQNRNQ